MKGTTMRLTNIVAGMILLVLCNAMTSVAASTISISSSGNGGFLLQGHGMENVAALDITILYETATLANPRVTAGKLISGAMMAVNPNVHGAVRLGIITTSTIKGTGVIANLVFDPIGMTQGKIIALNAKISNSRGNALPVLIEVVNPSGGPATSDQDTGPGSILPPATGNELIVISGDKLPSVEKEATEIKEPPSEKEDLTDQEETTEAVSDDGEKVKGEKDPLEKPESHSKQIYTQKSVLKRYQDHTGARSIKAFTALFDQEPLIGFTQEPLIVLSDGKARVKVTFIAMPLNKEKPDIQVRGATLISMSKSSQNTNTWSVELQPSKSSISAALIVFHEKVTMEFPLVVAPKVSVDLDKSGKVTEADFELFLREQGKTKKPPFDLNDDGKRDYMDDYIYTANYIQRRKLRSPAGELMR